jgi:hypothetical protein
VMRIVGRFLIPYLPIRERLHNSEFTSAPG